MAIRKLGWSQNELARRCQMNVGTIGDIINLHRRPSQEQADTIQRVLAEAGQYIDVTKEWPETFKGFGRTIKTEDTQDITPEMLEYKGASMALADVAEERQSVDLEALSKILNEQIDTLDKRHADVLRRRFINQHTLDQVAQDYGVTRTTIAQIEAKALRMLRHPSRFKKLEPAAELVGVDFSDDDWKIRREKYRKERGIVASIQPRQEVEEGHILECSECGKYTRFIDGMEPYYIRDENSWSMILTCFDCMNKSPGRVCVVMKFDKEDEENKVSIHYADKDEQVMFLTDK